MVFVLEAMNPYVVNFFEMYVTPLAWLNKESLWEILHTKTRFASLRLYVRPAASDCEISESQAYNNHVQRVYLN